MEDKPKLTTKFGKGNPGKPKGAISHMTRTAKEAIAIAADKLGGADRLVAWAKEDPVNERAFWSSIYPKLLPLQVNADINAFVTRIERTVVNATDTDR